MMALLMLLSAFGQVAAQSCAEMQSPGAINTVAAMPATTHKTHGAAEQNTTVRKPMSADHCGGMPPSEPASNSAHCAEVAAADHDDCGQTCACCPSHCATVLLSSETLGVTLPRNANRMSYLNLASSAEPESPIKPPRSA